MLNQLLMLLAVATVVYLLLRRRRTKHHAPTRTEQQDSLLPCPHCHRHIPKRHAGRCQDKIHCQL